MSTTKRFSGRRVNVCYSLPKVLRPAAAELHVCPAWHRTGDVKVLTKENVWFDFSGLKSQLD